MAIKKDNLNTLNDFIEKKLKFFEIKIHELSKYYYLNKINNILALSQYIECMNSLQTISETIDRLSSLHNNVIMDRLNEVNNSISKLIINYGTNRLEDLINICIEFNYLNKITDTLDLTKLSLIHSYFHPLSLHVVEWSKPILDNIPHIDISLSDQEHISGIHNLSFVNIKPTESGEKSDLNFFMQIYGCYLIIQDEEHKKSYVIKGFWDNLNIHNYFKNNFIKTKINEFLEDSTDRVFKKQFLDTLEVKDLLIYNNLELKSKYLDLIQFIKNQSVRVFQNIIKDFMKYSLFQKRKFLISLLVIPIFTEQQYLAYLLYDLMTKDVNGNIDSLEQTLLYDSLPFPIKLKFQESMEKTISYTEKLNNSHKTSTLSYENQIALMKCTDQVKEKAIQKMKEIKGKNDDSFLKAKHYLEGLLRIPFGIVRKEPILKLVDNIRKDIKVIVDTFNIPIANDASILDIMKYIQTLNADSSSKYNCIMKELEKCSKKTINHIYIECSLLLTQKKNITNKASNTTKYGLIKCIMDSIKVCPSLIDEVIEFKHFLGSQYSLISNISKQFGDIPVHMKSIKNTLDQCVYGHDEAKKQIERIIGQWMSGDSSGYCFGFEGPPGVGKTTLAKKGIAKCLVDEDGESRPFAMIQLGGDSNGSSLHGHNYTYVGSTWGNIVQILMDSKCMNPIIFIDEVDKVSKTENGREIIGILTHLLDVSQNDCFQDKYFTGIDLDLSKALFILSYNDVELIDRILLDRIHRIKFKHLTLDEKIVICEKHILPEIMQKMGLVDKIHISPDVLRFIIEKYTNESGVRKLKEILFNIIGDINLEILNKGITTIQEIPIVIKEEDVTNNYLKDRSIIKHKLIHEENKIGIINGLWANALGHGGIIPIQTSYYHCNQNLNLKLTGLQGDVMKESMNVALTLAWEKTNVKKQKDLMQSWKNNGKGIHIHCPEGAVPKDGPSAGAAITTAIYSLLNNIKIKHDIGITGEISLDGKITAIGGLDLKILGGIKAGIKEFIFPLENLEDFDKLDAKFKEKITGIQFYPVSDLQEVFNIILDYDA